MLQHGCAPLGLTKRMRLLGMHTHTERLFQGTGSQNVEGGAGRLETGKTQFQRKGA